MSSGARETRNSFLILLGVLLLSACGHEAVRRVPAPESTVINRGAADRAVAVALKQVGVPYRYGGASTSGFDCSGLTQYAWHQAGHRIPRTTGSQWQALSPVPKDQVARGDILFFRIGGRISHVGLYVGGGRFVHAPSSGRQVSVESLNSDFYRAAFVRAGRP